MMEIRSVIPKDYCSDCQTDLSLAKDLRLAIPKENLMEKAKPKGLSLEIQKALNLGLNLGLHSVMLIH